MDFVDLVHLETIIAYTINTITFTFIILFRHPEEDPDDGFVDDIGERAKQKRKKLQVMIEA